MKVALTTLVVIHLVASLWHGDAHTTLEIHLPDLKNLFVYIVIVAGPVAGAALMWTRHSALGAVLIVLSMVGALIFGVYHHYILVSPDNIALLPSSPAGADAQFINSAALIAILELVTALVAAFALGNSRAAQ
jgi:hypothetical protein